MTIEQPVEEATEQLMSVSKVTNRIRSNVRQLNHGERVVQIGKTLQVLDANDKVLSETPMSGEVPDFQKGWVAYASWTNPTTNIIKSMTTTWTVPSAPSSSSGQIIFLFNGLQNGSRILQPVLQWGSDSDDPGSGGYWVIASWNAGSQTDPFYVSPSVIRVSPGQQLVGSMVFNGTGKAANGQTLYNYTCSFVGFPGTALAFSTTDVLVNPVETLEVYGITKCSDYPATNMMCMRDINIAIDNNVSVSFGANTPIQGDCGEKAIVIQGSGNQGEVLIAFRSPAVWNMNDITKAATAPAANGSPYGYTYDKDSTEHVVYRGVDGNVHELWFNGAWHHNNLSTAIGNVVSPAGNLFGYMWSVDQTEHVLYRSADGHIHELWFNGTWHQNDLTTAAAAPLAAGDPVAHTYASDKTEHVLYRGTDGHIHELWFNNAWHHNDLTVAAAAPAGAGDPCSYVYPPDNTQHVVYVGSDAHLHELWFNGTWHHNDLTTAAGVPANAAVGSRPTGYYYAADRTEHVVYRCADGSIEELWFNTKWAGNLISAAAGGSPRAASDPVGYTWSADNTEHVIYRGVEGDIHELWYNGTWNYNDVTQSIKPSAAPKATGKPACYTWSKDNTEHVVYTSTTGEIIELWL